jgi:ribosomal protein S18 acetylase RimI-like enzyme
VDLGHQLQAHGLVHIGTKAGMSMDLQTLEEQPALPNFAVRLVTTDSQRALWGRLAAEAFHLSGVMATIWQDTLRSLDAHEEAPLQLSVGYHGHRPVGSVPLVFAGGVAGVHCLGVDARARTRGLGSALAVAALGQARDRGYRTAMLMAAPQLTSFYERLGFRTVSATHEYLRDPFETRLYQRAVQRVVTLLRRPAPGSLRLVVGHTSSDRQVHKTLPSPGVWLVPPPAPA